VGELAVWKDGLWGRGVGGVGGMFLEGRYIEVGREAAVYVVD
jgi:hypothetical protein